MGIIFKIAWRNIFRHKGKSFIIGVILFLGSFIMTAGNGVLSGMNKGLQENIVNRFTGDIVLIATNQRDEAVVGGWSLTPTEVISGYTNIKAILLKQPYIESFLPVCRGFSMILNEAGDMGFSGLLGVDIDDYQRMFQSNLVLVEGRMLSSTERGVLVTAGARKAIYNSMEMWLTPVDSPFILSNLSPEAMSNSNSLNIQSNMVLMGMSADGNQLDIRVPVVGIAKYKYLDSIWQGYSILDLESFRECFGYVTAQDTEIKISEEKERILKEEENLDSLFEDKNIFQKVETKTSAYQIGKIKPKRVAISTNMDRDAGIYNIVFVKLKRGYKLKDALLKLNIELSNSKASAKAISWKKAAGSIGDMVSFIKVILIVFVALLFLVAAIIITNTLSMSAIERTTEIGMMRAVGADKSFVAKMFASETAILSFFFGGLGMVIGAIVLPLISWLKVPAGTNDFLLLVFGGDYFNPILDTGDIIAGILILAFVTVLAMLYPVIVATRITPLEAIARD